MTQRDRILRALRKGPVNTTDFLAPACDAGPPILRVAARIHDLQTEGHAIRTFRKVNGTTTYLLVRESVEQAPSETNEPSRRSGLAPARSSNSEGHTPSESVRPAAPAQHAGLFDAGEYGRGDYRDEAA